MIKFKEIVLENLLAELSERNTLYHRSLKKMKVGDIIKPRMDKTGSHWLASLPFELVLEEYRKEKFPNAPSRLNCIYSSVVPKSRFVDKGYLYIIKPIGKMLMTNSSYIDILADRFSREEIRYYDRGIKAADIKANPKHFLYDLDYYLAQKYWKGEIENGRKDIDDIEILSESAKIIEIVNEENKLIVGNNVKVTESDKIYCTVDLYLEEDMIDKYESKSDENFMNFVKDVENLFSGNFKKQFDKYDYDRKSGRISIQGFLRKGDKLKILFIQSAGYRKYEDDYVIGKYKQMLFGFYLNNKYYDRTKNQEKNGLPNYRMQYFNHASNVEKGHPPDISLFLKKVR